MDLDTITPSGSRYYVPRETLPQLHLCATLAVMVESRRVAAHDSRVRAQRSGDWSVMDVFPLVRARAVKRCGCRGCLSSPATI